MMTGSTQEYSCIDKKQESKKIVRSFGWNVFAIFCCWSAYLSIFNLQSSINVEDGLGTNTFAVGYSVAAILSIVIAPAMMKTFGAKINVILFDCSMFLFIVANFYPKYYTLMPATVIMLLLQCAGFPSLSMLNVLYANLYSAITEKSKDHYTIRFSGYFFTGLQCSQVFGNILSYIVLYGFEQSGLAIEDSSINCSNSENTSCEIDQDRLQYCGINDCQNATVIKNHINQYKPISQLPLFVLLGAALFLEIAAILIHIFLVPSDESFRRKTKYFEQKMVLLENLPLSKETNSDGSQEEKNPGVFHLMLSSIKGVCCHLWQLQLMLILPITFYNGLAMSFVFSEITRSYTSCVIGVQWVGVCVALFGVFDAVLSWVVGQFGRRIGRSVLFVLTLVAECGNYIYCLLWSTSFNPILSICAIFCMFGFTDGILQTIINVTHIDMFPNKREVVLVVWNSMTSLGFSAGMMLSRMMCVRERIYLNLGFVIVGTILLVIADCRHRRRDSTSVEKDSSTTT